MSAAVYQQAPLARFDLDRFLVDVDRASPGVSRRQLAAACGLSVGALLRTFRGEGGCSVHTIASLARWADLSLDAYVVAGADR